MAKARKHIILRILLISILLIVISAGAFTLWLSRHYKQVISERLPQMVTNGSDSIYHISFTDISVNIFKHRVTVTNLHLWPDKKQAAYLRSQHRRIPPTLSTVSIPSLEAYGITWEDLISGKELACENVVVHNLDWLLECTPHPQDSLFKRDKPGKPFIKRISSRHVQLDDPNVTYHFRGPKDTFYAFLKKGTATLEGFAYNHDEKKDTSVFLFAKSGTVRLDSFVFLKRTGRYGIKSPTLDFETAPGSVTIKNVNAKNMIHRDPRTGVEKEIYNLGFPSTELVDFNWNNLINHNTLAASSVNATEPHIHINYVREHAEPAGRKGSYPNQLLLQVGMNIYLKKVNIKNGLFNYTEITKKDKAVIEFTGINGSLNYVTNVDSAISRHKSCVITLHGKYKSKSDVNATFNLSLTDTTGKYKVDGTISNLDGKDVSEQAAVFTLVKVTSFHLNKMELHIQGDETYGKGDFTVLYQDLKISLLKFDTKQREGKKGAFSFLGSALLLYPSNPMPDKDVRTVTTSFARDTTKGFFNLIWQHVFRAAKKTAVREKGIVTLTDGPETEKGEQPKKGFFKRLFKKKK